MNFYDLDELQAEAFRDYVASSTPFRLAELRAWLEESAGPLHELDGSLQSLVPLWSWAIDLGVHGLERVVGPRKSAIATAFGAKKPSAVFYASEAVSQYVFEVVRQIDPSAHWDILRRRKNERVESIELHMTGVVANDKWVWLDPRVDSILRRAFAGDEMRRAPDYLLTKTRSFFRLPDDLPQNTSPWQWPLASGEAPTVPVFDGPDAPPARQVAKTDIGPLAARRNLSLLFPQEMGSPGALADQFISSLDPSSSIRDVPGVLTAPLTILDGGIQVEFEMRRRRLNVTLEIVRVSDQEWDRVLDSINRLLRPEGIVVRDAETGALIRGGAKKQGHALAK